MQIAGEKLDRDTKGKWIADALAREIANDGALSIIVVDAVRIEDQIIGLRKAFGHRVIHIHLTASDEELAKRYSKRSGQYRELGLSYSPFVGQI